MDAVYRTESRRVLATLIRLLGDFDLAEEAMHDAFTAAIEQWPRDGVPANPRAWLVSTGRFKAITAMRKRARFDASLAEIAERLEAAARETGGRDEESVDDDRLRLIFTCCHPALTPDAQIALTLREVCGLDDRRDRPRLLHRSARPSRSASSAPRRRSATPAFPIRCRRCADLAERLDSVLHVVYLVFNEGYFASSGESLTRHDLSGEAIRLGRLLDRAAAGAGGDRAARVDAAARIAARRAHVRRRRADPARRSGSGALESRADCRGTRAGRARADDEAAGAVHAAGGDRGGARRGAIGGGDRLARRSSASTTFWSARIRRRWSS